MKAPLRAKDAFARIAGAAGHSPQIRYHRNRATETGSPFCAAVAFAGTASSRAPFAPVPPVEAHPKPRRGWETGDSLRPNRAPWSKETCMRATMILQLGILLFCGLGLLQAHALAAHGPRRAKELLHLFYLASGGNNWAPLAQAEVSGTLDLGGIHGTFHQIIDMKQGRDVTDLDAGPLKMKEVTLADSIWQVNQNGVVTYSDTPSAKRDAIDASFVDRNGWFTAPENELVYDGTRRAHGKRYDLVTVTPGGGRGMTLWLNARNHLLYRIVQMDAVHHRNITFFSDYRKIDGVLTPFFVRQSFGNGKQNIVETVRSMRFSSTIDQAAFIPPSSSFKHARLLGGRSSVTVPFTLANGRIIIHVSIDGHAPVAFLLDTGGRNYLTPRAARHLGVRSIGNVPLNGVGQKQENAHFAEVGKLRLDGVQMLHQIFVIGPLPASLEHRGKEKPIAGLLGAQLLQCFPTTFNYQKRALTFYKPGTAPPRPSDAQALPLYLSGGHPYVRVTVDGVAGIFGIDTGDNASTTIFGRFYRAHKFPVEQPVQPQSEGGIGGFGTALLTRVGRLGFGSWKLDQPLVALNFASQGAFSSDSIAGNLGYKTLRNFVFTLDYQQRKAYFVRSTQYGTPAAYNRSGMTLARTLDGKVVVQHVNPGTPAAKASLPVRATILSLNGKTGRHLLPSVFNQILSGKAGTAIEVRYAWNDEEMYTRLRLRELLPPNGTMKPLTRDSSDR
ncbi:MAG: aspartyl protease family protein [Acidobacteriaceae bacterium]